MHKIVFFLEELSAKKMLQGLLPRIIKDTMQWQLIHFNGKTDLEKNLHAKLRGWREPNTFFIILQDQDQEDCHKLKNRLCTTCSTSGRTDWIVRIACRELESWYLGDLIAVENALGITGIVKYQGKTKYRNPDNLINAADELMRLTDNRYFKTSGSERIGRYLALQKNRSRSYNVFIDGIKKAITSIDTQCRSS